MRNLFIVLALWLTASSLSADEFKDFENQIELSLSWDDQNSRDAHIALQYTFEEAHSMGLLLGRSKDDQNDQEVTSSTFEFSYRYLKNKTYQPGFALTRFGLEDEVNVRDFTFINQLQLQKWSLFADGVFGRIRFENPLNSNDESIARSGVRLGTSYFGFEPIMIGFSTEYYNYRKDLNLLSNTTVQNFFSDSSLGIFSSLLKKSSSLSLTYLFNSFDLNLSVGVSEDEINEEEFRFSSVGILVPVQGRHLLGLDLGRSQPKSDESDSVTFMSLSYTFLF